MSQHDDFYRGEQPHARDQAPSLPPAQWGQAGSGYGTPGPPGPPPGYPGSYGPPPPWAHARPTNTLAIMALVFAFVFAPAGLVLGIIARKQIKRTGEDGDGLALAGIIVGAIATGFFVLILALYIGLFVTVMNGGFS